MTPLPDDVSALVDAYARAVDAALVERGADAHTRGLISDDITAHAHELLAAAPAPLTVASARSILARLDAPSDYARQWAQDATQRPAPTSHAAEAQRTAHTLGLIALAIAVVGFLAGMIIVLIEQMNAGTSDIGGVVFFGGEIAAFICGIFARRTPPGRVALILSVTLMLLMAVLISL